jgi:hypothetical protein
MTDFSAGLFWAMSALSVNEITHGDQPMKGEALG